jgi:hypothetical protein
VAEEGTLDYERAYRRHPGDGDVLYVGSINISALVVILYCIFAGCHHWGNCSCYHSVLFLTLHVNLPLPQNKKFNLKNVMKIRYHSKNILFPK